MSTFAKNSREDLTGKGSLNNYPDDSFKSEVCQALALKLNLKTQQHANERMLRKMIATGGNCSSLKQAVQARAAVYSEFSDAS